MLTNFLFLDDWSTLLDTAVWTGFLFTFTFDEPERAFLEFSGQGSRITVTTSPETRLEHSLGSILTVVGGVSLVLLVSGSDTSPGSEVLESDGDCGLDLLVWSEIS